MRRLARWAIAPGFAAAMLCGPASRPAHAQLATVCVNCSDLVNQLLSYGKEVQSVATQLQQYGTQLRQYENMIQNTIALPQMVWANVQGDIMQVHNLMNVAQMLNGQGGSMMARLNQLGSYTNQFNTIPAMANQFQSWGRMADTDLSRVMSSLGVREQQQQNDSALLATLQQHSSTAIGQMQAIQAGNEMAALGVSMMQKNQEVIADHLQVSTDAILVAADRQALQDQSTIHFLAPDPLPTTGWPEYN